MTSVTWKLFLHYWPFVKGIYWSQLDSLHKGCIMQNFDVFFDVNINKLLD